MNTALLELRTEELPPAFCQSAPQALKQLLHQRLTEAFQTIAEDAITVWVTPRRLAVSITGLPHQQANQTLIHKGPPLRIGLDAEGKPTAAATAFATKCGVAIEASTQQTAGKETHLLVADTTAARPTPGVPADASTFA